MGAIEHLPFVTEASACDFTRPEPVDRTQDARAKTLSDRWNAVARYRITLSAVGDWNDKTIIAEWLPHNEAKRLSETLDLELVEHMEATNGQHGFARARYSIELHTPEVTKGNRAAVGDLVFHQVVEPISTFSLEGCCVFRQYYLPAVVTSVTVGGFILSFRDRDGDHVRTPIKPQVVSASLVDVDAAMEFLANAEKERGHWASECSKPREMNVLVYCQRLQAPRYPK